MIPQMKNSFGDALRVTLLGESHGAAVGCVVDGLAPGIEVDENFIAFEMDKRRASGPLATPRQEPDRVEILSGLYNGHTTGTPLTLLVFNTDVKSRDYDRIRDLPRPGHADYTGLKKYFGYGDPRGGGHFSGRLTAPIVAAGALCRSILARRGITLGTHLAMCAGVEDAPLPTNEAELKAALDALNAKTFAVLDDAAGGQMQEAILAAKKDKDSVGGGLETAVVGLRPRQGEPFFHSVESVLSQLYFSIPAVKGVEFGLGFGFAYLRGSESNDAIVLENGRVQTDTNLAGGLAGGVTNGMPLIVRAVVRATPSIAKPQHTVNLKTGEAVELELDGRHDPAILPRARAVADAMAAIGIVDLCSQRFGTLWQNPDLTRAPEAPPAQK